MIREELRIEATKILMKSRQLTDDEIADLHDQLCLGIPQKIKKEKCETGYYSCICGNEVYFDEDIGDRYCKYCGKAIEWSEIYENINEKTGIEEEKKVSQEVIYSEYHPVYIDRSRR